jgi:hypothetical protein
LSFLFGKDFVYRLQRHAIFASIYVATRQNLGQQKNRVLRQAPTNGGSRLEARAPHGIIAFRQFLENFEF